MDFVLTYGPCVSTSSDNEVLEITRQFPRNRVQLVFPVEHGAILHGLP